uniref:Uncharacterized protein n=1 Tax=Amphimedon queenslandica TaxID=400682 RepID=A0A1X7TN90_AMPQE
FEELINRTKSKSLYTFSSYKNCCRTIYSNGAYIPVKQRENTHHLSLFVLYKIFENTQPGHSKE